MEGSLVRDGGHHVAGHPRLAVFPSLNLLAHAYLHTQTNTAPESNRLLFTLGESLGRYSLSMYVWQCLERLEKSICLI